MNLTSKIFKINENEQHIFIRSSSKADMGVIEQIFVNAEYSISQWVQGRCLEKYYTSQEKKIPLILDLGANIGGSVIFFAENYPKAKIVAVEPDQENFELLKLNTLRYDVDALNCAIGSESGEAFLSDPGLGEWGFRINEKEGVRTKLISINELLSDYPLDKYTPMICKIDIEGYESELMEKNSEWFSQFLLVVIELHDWMLPFENSSSNFIKVLSENSFDICYKGENLFCFNNALKSYR